MAGPQASFGRRIGLSMAKPGMPGCMVNGEVLRVLWYDRIDSTAIKPRPTTAAASSRHVIGPTERPVDVT